MAPAPVTRLCRVQEAWSMAIRHVRQSSLVVSAWGAIVELELTSQGAAIA